jgi:hypothetical protein
LEQFGLDHYFCQQHSSHGRRPFVGHQDRRHSFGDGGERPARRRHVERNDVYDYSVALDFQPVRFDLEGVRQL